MLIATGLVLGELSWAKPPAANNNTAAGTISQTFVVTGNNFAAFTDGVRLSASGAGVINGHWTLAGNEITQNPYTGNGVRVHGNSNAVKENVVLSSAGRTNNISGHVFGVYVTSSLRRQGIGRALMTALLERAKQDSSLEQILLGVAAGQSAAKRVYRDCGFETYGTEPRAMKVGSEYIDYDHMILRIR